MDMSKDLNHLDLIKNRPKHQQVLLELLSLISNKDAQMQYEEDVPIANVPSELKCMWFDDHYPVGKSWFEESFSQKDQKLIEDFSNYYQQRLDTLPDTYFVKELHKSAVWNEIVEKARITLENIFDQE